MNEPTVWWVELADELKVADRKGNVVRLDDYEELEAKIAELEALNRKITDYSREKLAIIKANAIREMLKTYKKEYGTEYSRQVLHWFNIYANNLEKSDG
jgi:hypothetical protein